MLGVRCLDAACLELEVLCSAKGVVCLVFGFRVLCAGCWVVGDGVRCCGGCGVLDVWGCLSGVRVMRAWGWMLGVVFSGWLLRV